MSRARRSRGLSATAVALAALLALPSGAATLKVVAFGDSITEGDRPFDGEGKGGYPGRLGKALRQRGERDNTVINEGRGGEQTPAGAARITFALDQAGPGVTHVVIMEGTNDVNQYFNGVGSIENTIFNLNQMVQKSAAAGAEPILATIIPRGPNARRDRNNIATYELVVAIREYAARANKTQAEPWDLFADFGPSLFTNYYFRGSDPVGHPNAAGFELLAELFADKIVGIDNLAPVFSTFSKSGSETVLKNNDTLTALMHESGRGMVTNRTYFTINGREVDTRVAGNRRRAELTYDVSRSDLECGARIAVRSEDRANPPNIRNRLVGEFEINGAQLIKGDVSGDCRVDGFDLTLMGRAFGAERGEPAYSTAADTNNDRKVDGTDLAKLASNFGKSSS